MKRKSLCDDTYPALDTGTTMNENGSDNEEAIPERYLQCRLCGKQYGQDNRCPRLLPCLHSYCLGCLELGWDWAATGITCQLCSATWDVHDSVSATFPVNYVAMKLLTLAKVENSRTVHCTDCDDSKRATHRCVECHHFICNEGFKAHKQFVQLQAHRLLSIGEFLKSPSEMFTKEDMCDVHVGQPLDLFCLSDTCRCAICASCALVSHTEREGHCIGKVQEVYTDQTGRTRALIDQLCMRLENAKEGLNVSKRQLKRLEGREADIKSDIRKVFESLMEALKSRRDAIITTVDDIIQRERADFEGAQSETKSSEKRMLEAVEFANQALSVCSYAEFMELSSLLEGTMVKLQENGVELRCVEKDFQMDSSRLDSIKTSIIKFGDIIETCTNPHTWQPVVEVVDAHPGHEANIMEVKFINEINKMAATEVPKIGVKVERCDPQNSARVMCLRSHGESRKVGYQVKFTPPRDVKYRAKLTITHMKLAQDVFSFRCRDERGEGRDRTIYIAQPQLGDSDMWDFLVIKCPYIRLSEDTLNMDWCRLRDRTLLVNKPSHKQPSDSTLRLRSYPGAVGAGALREEGKCYWEVTCRSQVKQRWWGSIFETGLGRRVALDTPYIVGYSPYGWTLQIVYCTVHKNVCAQARNNRQTLYHLPLVAEELTSVLDVHVGFLMDFDTNQLHIIDVTQALLLYTFRDVDDSKQLWPFCGIFNNNWYSTELKMMSGAEVVLKQSHLKLLQDLCEMI
ncbi:uncharacterized protein LOC124140457 [Haliotis rufescens]|uniref:uncharacterized protein LOC124140457 n=1 Tax=Haliotis rufescens TaxID=6454 RepID=UPI00201FB210|nr:uncharacterized protein LOC124140457 [Haliotis rufescens]